MEIRAGCHTDCTKNECNLTGWASGGTNKILEFHEFMRNILITWSGSGILIIQIEKESEMDIDWYDYEEVKIELAKLRRCESWVHFTKYTLEKTLWKIKHWKSKSESCWS